MSSWRNLRQLGPEERERFEPRSERGRRAEQSLRSAARKVFRAKGYGGASVSEIAARAGVSNGTFYRYFRDKRDVLVALLDEYFRDMYEVAHAPWDAGNPMDSAFTTTFEYFRAYEKDVDLSRVLIEAAQIDPPLEEFWHEGRRVFVQRVARNLDQAAREGTLRGEVDPDLAAVLLGGMTEHVAYLRFVLGGLPKRDLRDFTRQLAGLWVSSVFRTRRTGAAKASSSLGTKKGRDPAPKRPG